jgi:acetoin utilization deacetylase AcuC-like enzyme
LKPPKPTPQARHLALLSRHGLLDDSPPFSSLPAYALALAGAASACVSELLEGKANVVVCWDGGRHHAMRERASGFCYVNDCVLVVLGLLKGRVERPLRRLMMTIDREEQEENLASYTLILTSTSATA